MLLENIGHGRVQFGPIVLDIVELDMIMLMDKRQTVWIVITTFIMALHVMRTLLSLGSVKTVRTGSYHLKYSI